jgi:hypothetical protein
MATVNIVAYADKHISKSDGDPNYVVGSASFVDRLLCGGIAVYDGMNQEGNIAFMAFDFTTIPQNKKIDSGILNIYKYGYEHSSRIYLGICEEFIEDNLIPDLEQIQRTHYFDVTATNGWYTIDITDLVNYAYQSANKRLYINIGKTQNIEAATDEYYTRFSSREGTDPEFISIAYSDLPPNPPTGLSPASETKMNDEIIRFSWTHNGTQTGDTQSKFDLLWSSNGGSTWNTVTQTTANNYYDMPADTLPVGSIIWKVRTYSNGGLVSEYSEQAALTSAGKPTTPVLTLPNSTENTSTPLISWTGTGQVMYRAQVIQGETVVWDSGEVASTVGQVQVGTALADGTSYAAKVRIKNQYDLWSDWATKAFTVDFEVPNKPGIDIIKDLVRFSSRITISNPAPDSAGGFAYNEIYRREVDGSWMRIATDIERDGTYEDCAMKSGQPYEYKVRAVGTYGYMDSDIKFSDIRVKDSQLASLTDKSLYTPLRYDPQRTISIGRERALMKFAGRPQAVTEFGEHIDKGLALRFVIESLELTETLMQLVESGETLLFRDGKGRKIYCTVGSLDIEELENYWTVSFAIAETSHQEAV